MPIWKIPKTVNAIAKGKIGKGECPPTEKRTIAWDMNTAIKIAHIFVMILEHVVKLIFEYQKVKVNKGDGLWMMESAFGIFSFPIFKYNDPAFFTVKCMQFRPLEPENRAWESAENCGQSHRFIHASPWNSPHSGDISFLHLLVAIGTHDLMRFNIHPGG